MVTHGAAACLFTLGSQMMAEAAPGGLERTEWSEVVKLGEQVSRQATVGRSKNERFLSPRFVRSVDRTIHLLNLASVGLDCLISAERIAWIEKTVGEIKVLVYYSAQLSLARN
jgi:hypothetical protein